MKIKYSFTFHNKLILVSVMYNIADCEKGIESCKNGQKLYFKTSKTNMLKIIDKSKKIAVKHLIKENLKYGDLIQSNSLTITDIHLSDINTLLKAK